MSKNFEVVIAGGGLIGGAIALELALAGMHVAIFEQGEPGREASWAGAGILSPAPENPAAIAQVPLSKASMALYPEFVARVEEISGEHVGLRAKGTLEALFSRDAVRQLSTHVALHHGWGLKAEAISADDARELEPALSPELEAAVLRPDEGSVDNRALTKAVLDAATKTGVDIFAHTSVRGLWKEKQRCSGLLLENDKISAQWTIIAAGAFSAHIAGVEPYAPVRPAKGQMISLRSDRVKIDHVLWSDKIYLVPRNDGRILSGATIEYVGVDRSVTAGALEKMLAATLELVPDLADATVKETWAGLRPDSPDHLPILGATDLDGLLIATGHFRSGILLAPITARLIREWVTQQRVSVDWDRFSPQRFVEARKEITA